MVFKSIALKAALAGILLFLACAARPPLHPPLHPIVSSLNSADIDPGITHGVLANGFQYIIKKNKTPENRVNVHLNVFAGSMNEMAHELGVAHFLEHMLFNGSEHFKPGELAQYFPSIGMDFGADANAHTSFFNTVYDLSLPTGDEKQMDEAFLIIQDYAKGALLLESEIDRERGIILAEKRERDSVSYRTFKKKMGFRLPGSLYVQRFPIGTEAVITQTDRNVLKSFYDRRYRPDNMVLVVVGDMEVRQVERMISQRFSVLKSRFGQSEPIPEYKWEPHTGQKAFYHHEPEAGSTEVSIETIKWVPFEPQSIASQKEETLRHIASLLVENRLSRMITSQKASFSDASAYAGTFLHHVSLAAVSATCDPQEWEKSLVQIDQVLRQCLSYGFEQRELDRVKAEYIAALEQQAAKEGTRDTSGLARDILHEVSRKGLLMSAEQRKKSLIPYIREIRLQDIMNALKASWASENRLVMVTGNADIGLNNPEQFILETFQKSQGYAVKDYKGYEAKKFPYLKPVENTDMEVTKREDNINGLGITRVAFGDSVQLNLKQTNFKQNEFLFSICFGNGRMSEPESQPGLSHLAGDVVDNSGLGQMDAEQLEEALAGRKIGFSFGIRDQYFSFSGSGDPKEASLIFDLVRHWFEDPGYREETLSLAKKQYRQQYDALMRTEDGAMQIQGDVFLAKGGPGFGLPHPETLNRYTLDHIQSWISAQASTGPVEISLVGDFEPQTIITAVQQQLGGLRIREAETFSGLNRSEIGFPSGEELDITLDTRIETGVVRVAFLTDDFWDIRQTRRLSVLSRVFSERLRLLLREELGQTYSPYVYNDPSLIYDGYGIMHAVVKSAPASHPLVYRKIGEITRSLAEQGVSENEMQASLKPVLTHIKTLRKSNRYWLYSVLVNSYRYPRKIGWAVNMAADYASISSKELSMLAKKYLNIDKSAKILIKSNEISSSK